MRGGGAQERGRGSLCKKGHFFTGRGMEKEKEGKEVLLAERNQIVLVKQEAVSAEGERVLGGACGQEREKTFGSAGFDFKKE